TNKSHWSLPAERTVSHALPICYGFSVIFNNKTFSIYGKIITCAWYDRKILPIRLCFSAVLFESDARGTHQRAEFIGYQGSQFELGSSRGIFIRILYQNQKPN